MVFFHGPSHGFIISSCTQSISMQVMITLAVFLALFVFSTTCSATDKTGLDETNGFEVNGEAHDVQRRARNESRSLLTPRPSTWQPWNYTGYEKFPAFIFAANMDSYFTPKEVAKIGKFSLLIIEFRHGQYKWEETTKKWANGNLEGFMENEAVRVHKSFPNLAILTYRSGVSSTNAFVR